MLFELQGTQATQCITLAYAYTKEFNFEILMNGLTNMKELRFLYVDGGRYVGTYGLNRNWSLDEDSLHLPNALRFLRWHGYPFSSLPKTFQANNLVGLQMFNNDIVQLWKEGAEKVE